MNRVRSNDMQATKYWTNSVDNDEVFGPAGFETKEEALEDGMKWAREELKRTSRLNLRK